MKGTQTYKVTWNRLYIVNVVNAYSILLCGSCSITLRGYRMSIPYFSRIIIQSQFPIHPPSCSLTTLVRSRQRSSSTVQWKPKKWGLWPKKLNSLVAVVGYKHSICCKQMPETNLPLQQQESSIIVVVSQEHKGNETTEAAGRTRLQCLLGDDPRNAMDWCFVPPHSQIGL